MNIENNGFVLFEPLHWKKIVASPAAWAGCDFLALAGRGAMAKDDLGLKEGLEMWQHACKSNSRVQYEPRDQIPGNVEPRGMGVKQRTGGIIVMLHNKISFQLSGSFWSVE